MSRKLEPMAIGDLNRDDFEWDDILGWKLKEPFGFCRRCGGVKWRKLEDPCYRCQGSGIEPQPDEHK
jgi:hypothetical protein